RVFDLLYMDGEDLRPLPLKERLIRLKKVPLHRGPVVFAPTGADPPVAVSSSVLARSADSHYRSGVDSDWIEVRGIAKPAPVSRGGKPARASPRDSKPAGASAEP